MKKKLTFDIFDKKCQKCQLKTFQKGTKNENFFFTKMSKMSNVKKNFTIFFSKFKNFKLSILKNKMSIMSNVKINFTHFTKNTEIQNGMCVKKMYILYYRKSFV